MTLAQTYLGWLIAFIAVWVLAVFLSRLKYRGMEKVQKQHILTLNKTEHKAERHTTQITADSDIESIRQQLQDLLNHESEGGVAESIKNIWTEFNLRLSNLLKLPYKLTSEGILFLILGGLVVTNIETLRRYATQPSRFDLQWVQTKFEWIVTGVKNQSMSSEAFQFVWAQLLSYIVQFYQWTYNHPFIVGGSLILGGILIYFFMDLKPDLDLEVEPYKPDSVKVFSVSIMMIGSMWLSLLLPYHLLSNAGYDGLGILVSLGIFACIFIGYLVMLGLIIKSNYDMFKDHLKTISKGENFHLNPTFYGIYYALRASAKTFGVIVSPILIGYVINLVVTEKIFEIVTIFQNSELHVQLLSSLVVLAVSYIIVVSVLQLYRDVRKDLSKVIQHYSIKIKLMKRGIPYLAIIPISLALYQMGLSILIAVGFAGVGAVVLRVMSEIYFRAKLQAAAYEDGLNPSLVTVRHYEVEDANDNRDPYPVIHINEATKLMGDAGGGEDLVDDAAEVIDTYFESGNIPMTLSETRYDRSFDQGLTWTDKEQEMRNEAREAIIHSLAENDYELPKRKLDELTYSFDEDIYKEELRAMHNDGVIRVRNGIVVLRVDVPVRDGIVDNIVKSVLG